jgi:GTP cyclohydrolase I
MPHLDFTYDEDFYPRNADLPDPQTDPVIPGARIPIDKVGVSGVDLPIKFIRRDGTTQELHASVSLYGSLDSPDAKGLNLSRFPIVMHNELASHLSIEGLKNILTKLQETQGSHSIYCKLKFKYQWTQEALRTRKRLPSLKQDGTSWSESDPEVFMIDDGKVWSTEKEVGHIFYDCVLEGQLHGDVYKFFLTVSYIFSSTCPCSFTLAQDAMVKRGKAANGHSQKSIAQITIEFNPDEPVYIEDLVEMARAQVPTEVVVICRRIDEQAFSELNGSNLLFVEDSIRLLYQGLDEMFDAGKISDFRLVIDHDESLHSWKATAITSKCIPNGLR